MTEWTVGPDDGGMRLDAWLARRPEIGSRGRARTAIERGKIFLNGEARNYEDAGVRLAPGDAVGYWEDRPGSARTPSRDVVSARAALHVVHEDDAVVAVDKEPGWLVEPLPGEEGSEVTLVDLLRDHLREGKRRPLVVHRIDRDTSGLVLFALSPRARDDLKAQFERRTPERIYLAVVHGRVSPPSGTWRDLLVWDKARLVQRRAHLHEEGAREAIARYRVLEQHRAGAVVEVSLVTGKRNQIRVQAGLRGNPLVGERLYAFGPPPGERDLVLDRQALHAASLGFCHPSTGRLLRLGASLPDDLRRLIDRLRSS